MLRAWFARRFSWPERHTSFFSSGYGMTSMVVISFSIAGCTIRTADEPAAAPPQPAPQAPVAVAPPAPAPGGYVAPRMTAPAYARSQPGVVEPVATAGPRSYMPGTAPAGPVASAPPARPVGVAPPATPVAAAPPANVGVAPPASEAPMLVYSAPPAPRAEAPAVRPSMSDVWVPGHWTYRNEWVWISGSWQMPPPGRHAWVSGQWSREPNDWRYTPGYWV
jgi:hypothetical protein